MLPERAAFTLIIPSVCVVAHALLHEHYHGVGSITRAPVQLQKRGCRMVTSSVQQSHPPVEKALDRLTGGRTPLRGWAASCPARHTRQPSLSIGLDSHGQTLPNPSAA